jgi:hypothetical protein
MMTLDELKNRLGEVRNESLSLGDFEEWFRTNSRGAYASPDRSLSAVSGSIEAAFSKRYFEGTTEDQLRAYLLDAIATPTRQLYQPLFVSVPSFGSNATEPVTLIAIQNAA